MQQGEMIVAGAEMWYNLFPKRKEKFLAHSWITGKNDSRPNLSCDDRLGKYTIPWNRN
jgi:hypothetical protein